MAKEFEGSPRDMAEDRKLAKKHKMSFDDWEKSDMDTKHDKQRSMKGLKKGGVTSSAAKSMGRNMARVKNQGGKK